jgi:hypothetical protein
MQPPRWLIFLAMDYWLAYVGARSVKEMWGFKTVRMETFARLEQRFCDLAQAQTAGRGGQLTRSHAQG